MPSEVFEMRTGACGPDTLGGSATVGYSGHPNLSKREHVALS
jgi:hypothetical protein